MRNGIKSSVTQSTTRLNTILISVIFFVLDSAHVSAQRNFGRGEYRVSEDEPLDFTGIWFLAVVVFIAFLIWIIFFKKEGGKENDGCFPVAVIAFVLIALWVVINFLFLND